MAIQIVPIVPKMRKRRGVTFSLEDAIGKAEAFAHIERNVSIRIVGRYSNKDFDRTFHMGDTVEFDSFNMSYHGKIVGITDKSVTIDTEFRNTKRLDLHTFMWRNYDFDLAASNARNHETMMYI